MRIVSGSRKGKKLATFAGREIRPTSDRLRQALFNILASRCGSLDGRAVLDLFAGTGALAIEALSRGAARAVLVDQGEQGARIARQNLRDCRLDDRAVVRRGEVLVVLDTLAADGPFDLIFLDPPYQRGLVSPALEKIERLGLLAANGIVSVETARSEACPETVGRLRRTLSRAYGAAALHLYEPHPEETS